MPPVLTARRRKEIASLARKKHRQQLGQMLVEGVRSVEAAILVGAPVVEVVVSENAMKDSRVQAMLQKTEVSVYVLPEREIARLSDVQASQGVLAVTRMPLCSEKELAGAATILALDGVQDPGNVGTLIRTAAWFGIDAVLAGAGTADLFQPKVVRSAMGGLWEVQLAQTTHLSETLMRLQQQGMVCYGADLEGMPASAWQPQHPSILVMGSEAHGLSPQVDAQLDERVAIGGSSHRVGTESLNVAVAAGVLMYLWKP